MNSGILYYCDYRQRGVDVCEQKHLLRTTVRRRHYRGSFERQINSYMERNSLERSLFHTISVQGKFNTQLSVWTA